MAASAPRVRDLIDGLRAIGAREHDEIAARVPHVLRRVGGYNLDVFNPQSERPYTRRRQRQLRAPARGQRRHARVDAQR